MTRAERRRRFRIVLARVRRIVRTWRLGPTAFRSLPEDLLVAKLASTHCCARVDDSLWKNPAPKPRERGALAEERELLLNRTVDA